MKLVCNLAQLAKIWGLRFKLMGGERRVFVCPKTLSSQPPAPTRLTSVACEDWTSGKHFTSVREKGGALITPIWSFKHTQGSRS